MVCLSTLLPRLCRSPALMSARESVEAESSWRFKLTGMLKGEGILVDKVWHCHKECTHHMRPCFRGECALHTYCQFFLTASMDIIFVAVSQFGVQQSSVLILFSTWNWE